MVQRSRIILILVLALLQVSCFKIKSKTPTVVAVTIDRAQGNYNPLPIQLLMTFPSDVDMSSIGPGDFKLRDTCAAGDIAISSFSKVGQILTLGLSNTGLCTTGESFTLRLSGYSVEFSSGDKKGSGNSSFVYVFDSTAPTVSAAINSLSDLTSSSSFTFAAVPAYVTYTFSGDVDLSTVAASDFDILSAGGSDCGTPPSIGTLVKDESNKTVRVSLTGASCADGQSFRISLPQNSVADSTRNGATGVLARNSGPLTDLSFDILKFASSVSVTSVGGGSTSASGNYHAGDTVDIEVAFDASVTVTGVPRLRLNVAGSATRYATYLSGTGSAALLFRYTVVSGDTSADLDYYNTGALQLNGGTISLTGSNGGIVPTLTLAAAGTVGSLGNSRNIVVDAVVPTISTSSPAGPTDSWGTAARSVTFTFSEAVDAGSLADSDLTITAGTCSGVPSVSSSVVGGAGGKVVTFSLTGNTCANGETYTLALNASNVTDVHGNVGTGSRSIAVTSSTTGPLISVSAPSKLAINSSGSLTYTVTYTGATSVTLSDSDLNLAGASTACSAVVTGSGVTTRTITITDCSDTGLVQLSLAAGTALSASGNLSAAVPESAITDFDADNTELTDPVVSLPTSGSNNLYNKDTLSSFTLTFAGDVLGSQSLLSSSIHLSCDAGSGPNAVTKTITRTSNTVVTLAPNESSGDFIYNSSCEISGTSVPDAAGNTHDFSGLMFKVDKTPLAISGPTGSVSIATATNDGTLGDVVFNVALDPTTVDTANATLSCDANPIAITGLSLSGSNTTVTIDFDESDANWTNLVGGESCELEFSTALTNSLGTPLSSPETFSFTTIP